MKIEISRQFLQKPATEWLFKYSDIHVHGLENLKVLQDTPAIFPFGPHSGHTDSPLVIKAFPKHLRSKLTFLSKAEYWHKNPFKNFLVQSVANVLPTPSKEGTVADYLRIFRKEIPALLKQGRYIAFSPEGTRNDPNLTLLEREFKNGLGVMIKATHGQYPVIPIKIVGAEHLMPKDKNLPDKQILLNGIIHIIFGEKIDYKDKSHLTSNEITLDVQNRMNNLKPPEMWSRARSEVF